MKDAQSKLQEELLKWADEFAEENLRKALEEMEKEKKKEEKNNGTL